MSNNTGEGCCKDALVKQCNQAREEYECQKQQLINETEKARPSAHRFVRQNNLMEDSLKNSTVGLVRLEDFQQKHKELEEAKASEVVCTDELKLALLLLLHFCLPCFSGTLALHTLCR
jgi:protein FAM50